MPLYEFECPECKTRFEHFVSIAERNSLRVWCDIHNDTVCKRLPGGHGMLFFEEGRQRVHLGLSNNPISSYAQQQKMMKAGHFIEGGNTVPESIRKAGPKSEGMKRFFDKGHKVWL